jgi:glycosyltransferase involved in cell wall biosynthesis
VLEHLERPRDALAELARVSRRALLFSVPREPLWRLAHVAAGRDLRTLGDTPGHINHWSARAFRSLVSEFGDVIAFARPFPWTIVLAEPHGLATRRRRPTGAPAKPAGRRSHVGAPRQRPRSDQSERIGVLAVTSSYPRFQDDPVAPFIESIVRSVAAKGHPMHVVLPDSHAWRRPAEEDGIHYHPFRYSPRRGWTPWGYAASLERGTAIRKPLYALAPVVFLSAVRTSKRVLERNECDVVHAHWVVPNGPIAAYVARRHRLPLVISLHGTDISISQRSRWLGRVARWSLAQAAVVTAPSEDLLERARLLGARGRLELIPYGADPEDFDSDPESRRELRDRLGLQPHEIAVFGIGRFIPLKGFDYLVDAVARVRGNGARVRLVLVGDGDLRKELEERVAALGLGIAVTFTGMIRRDELPGFYSAADVVAVPSVRHEGYVDGLPNVALEAMAAGKPLIASRVGGLPGLVRDGEDGLLVTERDVDGLAAAIGKLAGDETLRKAMGERGRRRVVESLNWDTVADRFVDVYERVVRSPARALGG